MSDVPWIFPRIASATPPAGTLGALLALAFATSCTRDVSLGDPIGTTTTTPDVPCADASTYAPSLAFDASFGELRALAASREFGSIAGIFTRADASGTLAVALTARSGRGVFEEVARIGGDPIALAFDGIHAWVSLRATGQVVRVRVSDGVVTAADNQSGATSIALAKRDGASAAFWTRPQDDAVMTWSFDAGNPASTPTRVATLSRARWVTSDGDVLYLGNDQTVSALASTDLQPRPIAVACAGGTPLFYDRNSLFCVDGARLTRVDVATGAVSTVASGLRNAKSVVAARGRAFFRTEGQDGATIQGVPIDGVGGPSTVDVVPLQTPSVLATDGCGLYYSVTAVGSSRVSRWAL